MNYAIIAAGEGSRLVQEGVKFPKPLVQLNGTSLIDRLIAIFTQNNADSINIIINEEMVELKEHLQSLVVNVPFHLIVKSTPSSMHSFYELSRFLQNGKFCLTTVDTIFKEEEFSAFIQAFENDSEHDGLMAVTDYIDDEKPLYIDVEPNTLQIKDFLDIPEHRERYVSGGIYCLTPKAIPILHECMEQGLSRMRNYQRQLIRKGLNLKAYPFKKIIDIDHAGDIAKAEQFLKEEFK
ncbi:MAG: NDP-sugar synthase [Dysgonamonadaceae bacterium]|jgi:NDP-sugar pyrophosphorylase family protein|nr:NDP-sugar synthase [Dysgonamonadaceae bacterium]